MAAYTAATGPIENNQFPGKTLAGEAGATIKSGWLVAIATATGKIIPAGGSTAQKVVGRARDNADTGDEVLVDIGLFDWPCDTSLTPTLADYGKAVYAQNQTSLTFTATGAAYAGICRGITTGLDGSKRIIVDTSALQVPAAS